MQSMSVPFGFGTFRSADADVCLHRRGVLSVPLPDHARCARCCSSRQSKDGFFLRWLFRLQKKKSPYLPRTCVSVAGARGEFESSDSRGDRFHGDDGREDAGSALRSALRVLHDAGILAVPPVNLRIYVSKRATTDLTRRTALAAAPHSLKLSR